MSTRTDDNSLELLSRIASTLDMWKYTLGYIAVLLTVWFVTKIIGVM